jgi:shikimate dehydrogenase
MPTSTLLTSSGRPVVGIIGDPVAHSLSPAFQQPALDAAGIPATFEKWHTPLAALAERVAMLRAPGTLGACVTVPHKINVMPLLDEIAESGRLAGACNTIVALDGRLIGENTDHYGFRTSLAESDPLAGSRPALVLGAGGAARAVVLALHDLGTPEIIVANRRPDRARMLADDLPGVPLTLIGSDEAALRGALPSAGLLVNATSLGWHSGETPIELGLLELLPAGAFVADLTYRDTDLLVSARQQGFGTLDGLGMLVHQGARQFSLWTGLDAPLDVMWQAALIARAERS